MLDTGRTEEMCRQMDDQADEDHTHHLTPEEIQDYRVNWWIRSNTVGSDTMPVGKVIRKIVMDEEMVQNSVMNDELIGSEQRDE